MDTPSLHWIFHDTSEQQFRVFTDEDIRYGSFDVISADDWKKILDEGIYKGKPYVLDEYSYVAEED